MILGLKPLPSLTEILALYEGRTYVRLAEHFKEKSDANRVGQMLHGARYGKRQVKFEKGVYWVWVLDKGLPHMNADAARDEMRRFPVTG